MMSESQLWHADVDHGHESSSPGPLVDVAWRTTAPVLSVIIPARNEAESLPTQLGALSRQDFDRPWELIVVDNGSIDRTAEVALEFADQITQLHVITEHRPGVSVARQTGIAAASASRLAFCDADDIVSPGWVRALYEALERYPIVTGPLDVDSLNAPGLRDMRGRSGESSIPTFFGVFPYPRGNNLGVRRSVLQQIGSFDQAFAGGEDIELGLRAWRAGLELGLAPAALVSYRYRTATKDLWRQGYYYGRVRPHIRAVLTDNGLPAPPRLAGWRSWLLLLSKLPTGVTSAGRQNLAWIAGNRFGQLAGSWSARHLFV